MLKVNTPLAFFVMRRPKITKKVINVLKKIKFPKIYIVCDNGRNDYEKENVNKVRKIIEKNFLKRKQEKIYFEENIGIRKIFPVALKYIFKKEKKIIVIEDDVLPHISFFKFADDLLKKYKNNKKISLITGLNLNSKLTRTLPEDYFFSKNTFIWGWATWRDRWDIYDPKLINWCKYKNSNRFKYEFPIESEYRFWSNQLSALKKNLHKGAWDFPLSFANFYHKRFSIVPRVNLIKNLGIEDDPTGINPKKANKLKYFSLNNKIIHPKKIATNLLYDNFCAENYYYRGTFFYRLKNKIKKLFF